MSRIIGEINIDFETGKEITQEQFDRFQEKMNKLMEDWEMMLYDAADGSGFEADDIHPIILNGLDCVFDD